MGNELFGFDSPIQESSANVHSSSPQEEKIFDISGLGQAIRGSFLLRAIERIHRVVAKK